MIFRPYALLIPLALVLMGCDETFEERIARLGNSAGEGSYWLIQNDAAYGPQKIALYFGVAGNGDICEEMAALYAQRYPRYQYTCAPVEIPPG